MTALMTWVCISNEFPPLFQVLLCCRKLCMKCRAYYLFLAVRKCNLVFMEARTTNSTNHASIRCARTLKQALPKKNTNVRLSGFITSNLHHLLYSCLKMLYSLSSSILLQMALFGTAFAMRLMATGAAGVAGVAACPLVAMPARSTKRRVLPLFWRFQRRRWATVSLRQTRLRGMGGV